MLEVKNICVAVNVLSRVNVNLLSNNPAQKASIHTYSQSSFSISTPFCIYNKLLLCLLVIHYEENCQQHCIENLRSYNLRFNPPNAQFLQDRYLKRRISEELQS